jgi:hypothetical protein
MLIFDRENRRYHRSWFMATVAATVAAAAWYVAYGFSSGSWNWPGGASPPGFTYGVLGGVIILFEMLLWPRKSLWRGWRLGRTKVWMTAHIWLGLLTLPLLVLHGGFHFNPSTSTLAAVLMWLLVIVIVSGVFGVAVQNIVPRLMLDRVPAETIASQIPEVLDQYCKEAERLVRVTCGRSPDSGSTEAEGVSPATGAIETASQVGRSQVKVIPLGVEAVSVPDSEPLHIFYRDEVVPYLRAKSGTDLPLGSPRWAQARFRALKVDLRPEAHPAADRLAILCDHRRQFDLQARLHAWLFTWLGIHVAI